MSSKRPRSIDTSDSASKRKHKSLSIREKVDLLQELEKGASVRDLCERYNVGSSTVYDLKKQRDKLYHFSADNEARKCLKFCKTLKEGKSSELERALLRWLTLRHNYGEVVSGEMIVAQAKAFHKQLNLQHSCQYSHGWLHRFKKRHGLSSGSNGRRVRGGEEAVKYVDEFAQFVERERLSPEQVYNADETALYWRCMPRKTEGEELPADDKDRVTVLGCSNAAGTHRCKVMVIGKSVNPQAFKDVNNLPVTYRGNRKGWMTTKLFLEWFEDYFVLEARAHCNSVGLDPKCKIVLILDICSAHPKAELLVKDNVIGMYLPPNCTSLIQPCDQGILHSLKCNYRAEFMHNLLTSVNNGKSVSTFMKEVNLMDAMWTLAYAWDKVTSSVLRNSWHNLWPALMFEDGEELNQEFAGFTVPEEKQIIRDLLEQANAMVNPGELASYLCEEQLEEWMEVDKDAPTVSQLSDEIIEMVKTGDAKDDETSKKEEEDIQERISSERCIQMCTDLIFGLKQWDFITEHEIRSLYLIQAKLIKEKPKYMKQANLHYWFKKIAKKTLKNEI